MHSLEQVARLLRGGHGAPLTGPEPKKPKKGETPRARLFSTLAGRAGIDPPARGRAPLALAMEAAGLLEAAADAVAGLDRRRSDPPAPGRRLGTGRLGRRPRPPGPGAAGRPRAERLDLRGAGGGLDRRSLAAASLAGLAALSGPLHGGMAARVGMFVDEAERRGPGRAVAERLAQGSAMPGFGHPLYPDGDPRAAALLDAFKVPAVLAQLRAETEAATGQAPNIDFALVAMARTLSLPADAPFSLFAVGRMAGWHAHAIEQLQTGKLIRPRARYVTPKGVQDPEVPRWPPGASMSAVAKLES
jgi:citrate synthase